MSAADLTWVGGEGDSSGFNFSDFGNWEPSGYSPSGFDNVTIGNFTATTSSRDNQYKINGFTEVNDLRIENLVLPDSVRFFIYTVSSGTPTINGNVFVGNIDVGGNGGEWRSPNIRGYGVDFVVKGSITIAPTSGTSQSNASVLTFGGTNRSGFFKSLSIGENAAVDSSTGYKTAVYLDASYAGANLELAGVNLDGSTHNWAVIHGVVQMNNSADGQKFASLMIGRNEAEKYCDSHVAIGGLNGSGRITTKLLSDDSNAATSYLTFQNAEGVNTSFTGSVRRVMSNYRDNVAFVMDGAGTQSVSLSGNSGAGVVGVTVKNGTFYLGNSDSSGALVMEGGKFGAINGGTAFDSAVWKGGAFSFANHETFYGGTPDKITVTGTFSKEAEGQIAVDFEGLDATDLIGYTFDLISAGVVDGTFSSDANDDFAARNLLNAMADFAWNGNALQVTFSQVPEPAAFAALIGAVALALAARRGRR
ncbi:MAG: hypothetical protein J6J65_04190 [Opitutales bacterium]|nr:hypothetical protein [Opitutales bacterium]